MRRASRIGLVGVSLLCLTENAVAWWSSSSLPSSSSRARRRTTRPCSNDNAARLSLGTLFASNNDAENLKEQAERLRQEISSFEKNKEAVEQEQQNKVEAAKREKQAVREQYSAVVPILKPDGSTSNEQCEFKPRFSANSFITVCEADVPLGIILGESEVFRGTVVVDEVAEGSNGEAAGIQVGDLLRAATACRMEMEAPTWQLIAGGIGIPKTKRFMYSVDGRPFEEVMDAVGSNRLDPENRPALLVVERKQ